MVDLMELARGFTLLEHMRVEHGSPLVDGFLPRGIFLLLDGFLHLDVFPVEGGLALLDG